MTIFNHIRLLSILAVLVWSGCQQMTGPARPTGPTLGLQAWTYNNLTLAETADKAAALGIHHLQGFTRQRIGGGIDGTLAPTIDEPTRTRVLAMLKEKGVTMTSMGVVSATTETEWRQLFTFAQAMGMRDIAVEPPKAKWPTELPLLDQLAREFGVGVTFHNHYNPDNPPEHLVTALQPYGKHMGFCADTGHWARSGFDPVAALRKTEGRLISLHFKDVIQFARNARDVPWGTGVSHAAGQLVELRRQGFTGIVYLEYEARTPMIEAEIARCVDFFRRAATASDADLLAGRLNPPAFAANSADSAKQRP